MMKRFTLSVIFPVLIVLGLVIFISTGNSDTDAMEMWPELKPYKTGYFKVSDLHQLYYQLGGNPKGKPVMVLHGGPGGGCYPIMFRYFNPDAFHIILHDQRGAGKSKPYAELKGNTTQNLVEDIEKLRQHLGLGPVILFGGSWGSTLALAYAETYPQNVKGIVIRGIFAATKEEIDHFYHGGAARFFPAAYRQLISTLERPVEHNLPSLLLEKLRSTDADVRRKYAEAWARYELKIAFLEISNQVVDGYMADWNPYAFALIENYYMANGCFLEEGQLIKNAHKLKDIPLVMVNGRYDVICPPITAYKLHKILPESKLIITEKSGHVESEGETRDALLQVVRDFE